MAEARHSLETVAQTRRDIQAELTDLIRSRTELECIVEDLRAANQNSGGRREDYEAELEQIEEKITEKGNLLAELIPEWEEQRTLQATEKRRLDDASARLSALFAKQGRASKFRTKSERDAFLRQETSSVFAYQKNQESALDTARGDLEQARRSQKEVDDLSKNVQGKMDQGKRRMKELQDSVVTLKAQQMEMVEKRKDLWREDTKLDSLVSHASDELKTTERLLAGMMDKVCNIVHSSCCRPLMY
jgi:structural maintenance of chromosome 3 (chondroitin sulfate proteoglycan 6)